MFNIPFNYREGYSSGDPIPVFGTVKAILWVDSLKGVFNGLPYSAATINNTDIRLWKDQTIYANNLTAATTNSPTYSAATFAPSGTSSTFPYLNFNDVNSEYLAAPNSASLQGISSGFTVFFVMRKNPLRVWSSGNPIIEYNAAWTFESEGFGVDADSSPTSMDLWYANNSFNTTTIQIPWGSQNIDDEKFYYYTYRMSGGTVNGYVGQTLKATTVAVGADKKMKAVSSTAKFSVAGGFNGTTFAQASSIDVAEVLVYDGAVPDSGMVTVWNYFKSKYGFVDYGTVPTTGTPTSFVYVGPTGSSSSTNIAPVSLSDNYYWAGTIYPKTSINTGGTITQLAYYVNNSPSNRVLNNVKIYMGHTTNSSFPTSSPPEDLSTYATNWTLVYDGTVTFNNTPGWSAIPLQTGFTYNNVNNLLVKFESRDGSQSGINDPFFRYTATTNTVAYNSGSVSYPTSSGVRGNERPNIRLGFL